MNMNSKTLAGIVLASAVAGHAYAADAPAAKKPIKHHARAHRAAKPSLQSEIEQLRQSMAAQQSQIQALQQQLTTRDAQVQQAQQQAQMAAEQATQQAAQQTQAAAAAQQATAQNTQTVNSLRSAVSDLQTKTVTIADNQKKTLKAIEHPDEIHFKDATLSPTGSFIEFATVNRTRATGSDIPTPFSSIPFTASDAGQLSEFEATGRQSRLALLATTKVGSTKLSGYFAMDWLGTGVTSNNNQSNSYVVRERELWVQAAFADGLTVTGGQQWSLATEDAHAIDNRSEVLPPTIDPNYSVGFVWTRQPSIRVTYKLSPMLTFGVSAEAAQTLTPACSASSSAEPCAVNYLVGQSGTGGGLYNSTSTYSYNYAPDLVAKVAFDPKMGHFELFGIERNFRDRVYPNENPQTGKVIDATLPSGAGAYNDSLVGGGIGGSGRIAVDNKRFGFGLKGLYGDGTGRYAATQLPDLTVRPDGQFALLHNFSLLASADAQVTKRFTPYILYGTDYVGHDVFDIGTAQVGYGSHQLATSGCGAELAPGAGGYTPTNAGSCSVNTKDTREATLGYWYDFYKGAGGRFRQGFQYSWVERNTYTGLDDVTPTAVDNVFETSLRYYLP
jgi:hypothetical protein